jgi:3-oxoacyl-[acyl-carrier protein] reductase
VKLSGKRILVTGASRGLGRVLALAFARAGAVVGAAFHRSADEARSLAAEAPERIRPLELDVRSASSVDAAVAGFAAGGGLDALVNNAGLNAPSLLVSADTAAVAAQIETNLLGPLLCCRAALKPMLEKKSGVILNVSSVAAERPARGQCVYAATKAGLESATRALAVEYGRKGIRCVAIRAGALSTGMFERSRAVAGDEALARTPLGRLGDPAEVAALAVWLLSDEARHVTGAVYTIDGGYLVS